MLCGLPELERISALSPSHRILVISGIFGPYGQDIEASGFLGAAFTGRCEGEPCQNGFAI
jgi:hypothetical protein